MSQNQIPIIFRLLSTLAFLAFAFLPGWIVFQLTVSFVKEPNTLVWQNVLLLIGSIAFLYFFGLLAYRAFTGIGRAKDGGLLPQWVMKSLVHLFGIIAILIIVIGVLEKELLPILGGAGYLVIALLVLRNYKHNRHNDT